MFKLRTIEVHNPSVCNVNLITARRLNFVEIPYDNIPLKSLWLNKRPVVDIDYYKAFYGISSNVFLDLLEINFISTNNGLNPNRCELRVFVEK